MKFTATKRQPVIKQFFPILVVVWSEIRYPVSKKIRIRSAGCICCKSWHCWICYKILCVAGVAKVSSVVDVEKFMLLAHRRTFTVKNLVCCEG